MEKLVLVTEKDLPVINAILRSGERVSIVPIRGGKRIFRIRQKEVKPPKICVK